uniref:P27 family phage terminase small subunit n=1 Tax=Spirosoma sp. TaxID=1899569 RepID=UPI003B3A14C1
GAVFPIKNKDGLVVKIQKNPYASLRKESLDEALKMAGQFGFTPAARARLTMGGAPEKSKSRLQQLIDRAK